MTKVSQEEYGKVRMAALTASTLGGFALILLGSCLPAWYAELLDVQATIKLDMQEFQVKIIQNSNVCHFISNTFHYIYGLLISDFMCAYS